MTLTRSLRPFAAAALAASLALLGLSAVVWLGHLTVTQVVTLSAGVVLAMALLEVIWVLIQVLRQQGRLVVRLDTLERQLAANATAPQVAALAGVPSAPPGLPVGTVAPSFALSGLYGETLTLDALRAPGNPVVLVFSDPSSGPCVALLPEIGHPVHGRPLSASAGVRDD
jgi:hypothetical protein